LTLHNYGQFCRLVFKASMSDGGMYWLVFSCNPVHTISANESGDIVLCLL